MVNTVGSYKNNWYKKSVALRSVSLSKNQMAVVIGSMLGDGSYSRRTGIIDISTYSFSLPEINILQKSLNDRFDIKAKYYRDRNKGHRMYCSKTETRKLIKIIKPYIIPSMRYKVGSYNPVTTESLQKSIAK
jgi:LAGLIDADG DNA endonuclease family